ncbi:hypothetical protein L9F63_013415, partial [Diploptera punctata]
DILTGAHCMRIVKNIEHSFDYVQHLRQLASVSSFISISKALISFRRKSTQEFYHFNPKAYINTRNVHQIIKARKKEFIISMVS